MLEPERLASEPFRERIAAYGPDLAVVAAYGRLLPDPLLATPRLGTINVHASLLPKYRAPRRSSARSWRARPRPE